MNVLIIGRKNLFHKDDVAEEYEIYKSLNKIVHAHFFAFDDPKSKLPIYDINLVLLAKGVEHKEQIQELRRHFPRAKIIYWNPDFCHLEDTPSNFKHMVENIDLYVSKHEEDIWCKENNIPYLYWNFDVACSLFKEESDITVTTRNPQTPYPNIVPVGFVGNWVHNSFRTTMLKEIQNEIPDLHLTTLTIEEFKNRCGLNNLHNPLYGSDFNKLVGITKINLSIEHTPEKGWWSPRTARIMAAGGFALVYYIEGMAKRFGKNGENVVYFTTPQEAIQKIKYYLDHEEERLAIAKRGKEFAEKYLRPDLKVKELHESILLRLYAPQDKQALV